MDTKSESRKLTDDYLGFAREEFLTGNLAEKTYCKVMMQVAAEYLIEHNSEEDSLKVLNMIPEHYFKDLLAIDMGDDSFFGVQMVEFAHHLERQGITFEAIPKVTQKEGQA